ncbi:hypothetical protein Taro_048589 [Colocasia esculenta]|uniref:Uncharacterized protein n=1 Tax=Colocasia esculenta TaxID=4460 RepID=A0A843X8I9_COLES|nr:hypothetical protein [Colocasia esculenta]
MSAVLSVNTERPPPRELPKKMHVHPPSASCIQLPDGRNLAYREQGVPVESARFFMIVPHSFLSSRLAGAAMFAAMVNPYEAGMTKEEKYKTWEKWNAKRKFLYILARKFPSFLPYFYRRSFLSGKHGEPEKLLSLSLGKKAAGSSFRYAIHPLHVMQADILSGNAYHMGQDKALMDEPVFKEFWERDVEESVRQGDTRPFAEEAILQVSNWGFSLADLQVQKKHGGNGLLMWLKSFYTRAEREWAGFLGPIHIWQGFSGELVCPTCVAEDFLLVDACFVQISEDKIIRKAAEEF